MIKYGQNFTFLRGSASVRAPRPAAEQITALSENKWGWFISPKCEWRTGVLHSQWEGKGTSRKFLWRV